jgi:endonuclease YncB( thermonuclease family)
MPPKIPRNKQKRFIKPTIKALIAALLTVIGLGAFHKELLPVINVLADYIAGVLLREPLTPGSVIAVYDGDTFTMSGGNGETIRVRLYGIDAPEIAQTYGEDSRNYLASMIEGKTVALEVADLDRYGRTVGLIYADNESVNEKMLATGNAWYYESYCKKYFCRKWKNIAAAARADKAGLWKYETPIAPWEFRR